MARRCVSCGRGVTRYATRCQSCARARWAADNREALLVQLAAARASRPSKPKRPRRPRHPERVEFDAHAIRRAVYAAGFTLSDISRQARVPAIGSELRKRTLPFEVVDRIAVSLGRHVSEFVVSREETA